MNIHAFGMGEGAKLEHLRRLDPQAEFQGTAPDGSSSRFYRVLGLPDEERLR